MPPVPENEWETFRHRSDPAEPGRVAARRSRSADVLPLNLVYAVFEEREVVGRSHLVPVFRVIESGRHIVNPLVAGSGEFRDRETGGPEDPTEWSGSLLVPPGVRQLNLQIRQRKSQESDAGGIGLMAKLGGRQ